MDHQSLHMYIPTNFYVQFRQRFQVPNRGIWQLASFLATQETLQTILILYEYSTL